MRKNGDSLRFVSETAKKFFIFGIFFFKDLDCNGFVVDNIDSLINLRHSAYSDKLGYFISSIELFANVFIHSNPPELI